MTFVYPLALDQQGDCTIVVVAGRPEIKPIEQRGCGCIARTQSKGWLEVLCPKVAPDLEALEICVALELGVGHSIGHEDDRRKLIENIEPETVVIFFGLVELGLR